jgi:hypothetical protein
MLGAEGASLNMSDFPEEAVPKGHKVYNLYCDESCHLEHDRCSAMGFGAISIDRAAARSASKDIRALKQKGGCRGELKWTKVSDKNAAFYCDMVDYFFASPELSFRALIVNGKERLNHELYNQGSHDLFYYKMYYYLVRNVAEYDPNKELRIFIDIKDTKSSLKVHELGAVLRRSFHDPEGRRIARIQHIRSNESELLQLADFLLGAVVYDSRELMGSMAKRAVIKRMIGHAHHGLRGTTAPWEQKLNLYHFWPRQDS